MIATDSQEACSRAHRRGDDGGTVVARSAGRRRLDGRLLGALRPGRRGRARDGAIPAARRLDEVGVAAPQRQCVPARLRSGARGSPRVRHWRRSAGRELAPAARRRLVGHARPRQRRGGPARPRGPLAFLAGLTFGFTFDTSGPRIREPVGPPRRADAVEHETPTEVTNGDRETRLRNTRSEPSRSSQRVGSNIRQGSLQAGGRRPRCAPPLRPNA